MAPRAHYAKSQEVVYIQMGTSARPRYKPIRVKLHGSKRSEKTAPGPSAKPAVLPPQEADDHFQLEPDEGTSFPDYDMLQRKKVSLADFTQCACRFTFYQEAVRLYEGMAEG